MAKLNKSEKEKLYKILKNIEDKLARPYFSNFIRHVTGINNIENPNFDEKKKIFLRLIIHCIYNLVGGRANIKNIQETHKNLKEFIFKLNECHFKNFDVFQKELEAFIKKKKSESSVYKIKIEHKFYNQKVFENLQHFKGIGQKNSALFLKFILRYTGVFDIKDEKDKINLVVPLDRIIWRFYNFYILGRYKFKKNFNTIEFNKFQKFCISFCRKAPVLFDNIWLIGHFYGELFKEKNNFDSLLKQGKNKFLEKLEFYIFEYPNKEFKLKNLLQDYF